MFGNTSPSTDRFVWTDVQGGDSTENLSLVTDNTTSGSRSGASLSPVLRQVIIIAVPTIVLLGVTGNMLSVCVMLRRRFRSSSTSVYLVALGIVDSIFLVNNMMVAKWIQIMSGIDVRVLSLLGCRLYVYLLYVSKCLGAWLLVSVSCERLVAISKPHKARTLCTKRRAYYTIATLVVVICAIYASVPYAYVIVSEGPLSNCAFNIYFRYTVRFVNVIDFVGYCLIPSVLLFCTNAVLVWKVIQSTRLQKTWAFETMSDVNPRRSRGVNTRRLTIMLLAVSLTYLLLTLPMVSVILYNVFIGKPRNWVDIFTAVYHINLCNNALNFVLYCLSGPTFRRELSVMFRCRREKGSHNVRRANYSLRTIYRLMF